MAVLLGVSTRAIQSYEQGWRSPPSAVLRLAAYLLYLHRRQNLPENPPPCWEVRGCDPDLRQDCVAFQTKEGQCCWMIAGNPCGKGNGNKDTWRAKLEHCAACEVMKRWLDT